MGCNSYKGIAIFFMGNLIYCDFNVKKMTMMGSGSSTFLALNLMDHNAKVQMYNAKNPNKPYSFVQQEDKELPKQTMIIGSKKR